MPKVTTLQDFHDKTQIDDKTGVPRLVPAGTEIEVNEERWDQLAARRIVPPRKTKPAAEPAPAVAPTKG